MAKFGYQNSKTPEPIVTKFDMGNYVGYNSPHAKTQFPGKWVKYYSRVVFSFFFVFVTNLASVPRLNRSTDFNGI